MTTPTKSERKRHLILLTLTLLKIPKDHTDYLHVGQGLNMMTVKELDKMVCYLEAVALKAMGGE